MKQKNRNTILWMVVFAAVAFCLIPILFAVVVFSHIMAEDASLQYVLWPLRFIFIASPWVAWWLGLRGVLPGTKLLAATEPGVNKISRILGLTVVVIVALFAVGAWVAFLPPPGRPNLAITFCGYTNDATGLRLAKIAVTNLNATTLYVYEPRIEIQAPTDSRGDADYFSGVNCAWGAMLDRGASGSFTIPSPTNPSPWRLSFYVYPDRGGGVKNRLKRVVSISCLSVGLWPLFYKSLPIDGAFNMPYNIEGDWIKPRQ